MITNLDRLEELLSKATPTPWGMVTHMGIPGEGTVYGIRFDVGYRKAGRRPLSFRGGLSMDRDWNAAINILRLGLQSVGIKNVEALPLQG